MAELINLRTVRKQRARADKDTAAEANRLKHGRTKADKAKDEAVKSLATKSLDAHRREPK